MSDPHRTSPLPPSAPDGARLGDGDEPGGAPPFIVALCGWLLPGAGYWLIGHRARALVAGLTILTLFAAGVFIGGIRVIDVPGYGESGRRAMVVPRMQPGQRTPPQPRWLLTAQPLQAVLEKPWYIGQILAGPVTLVASYLSLEAADRQYPKATAHVAEFGTLYCAVAGMLNLLIILDSASRAAGGEARKHGNGNGGTSY